MKQLNLIFTKDKCALEGAIERGATLYVEPSPSIKGEEYFAHEYEENGSRGRLVLVGKKCSMSIFGPVVTSIEEAGNFLQLTIENLSDYSPT